MSRDALLVAGAIAGLVALWVLVSYNRFVAQRNLIGNSWSNVDTELRRRYDLIPNLVDAVKAYAAHESAVLQSVTSARATALAATGSAGQQGAAEAPLVAALRKLIAVAEAHPDLKASRNYLDLQAELVNTEDRIQAARRFFNANVADYNRRVRSVPSNLIAGLFGFAEESYFEIEPAIRAEVERAPGAGFAPRPPLRA